ncbi:hypothetical protein MKW94_015681 [Papaver nudicaule]|uniref:Ribosome biogenesis protein BOP1 homolog n=1 Tax=Papaver nudicaule TaxID=74823 RepID=A0AA41UXS1_PAPNU|nr:hypothetical protein [Papaver nudicaule]
MGFFNHQNLMKIHYQKKRNSDKKKNKVSMKSVGDDIIPAVEESDSSEDEVAPRNTIGNAPLNFYTDEEHIGYDISGKKIKKQARKDMLEAFLARSDYPWNTIYDEYNDEEVEIPKEWRKLIRRYLKGKTPHADVDPYPEYVDWVKHDAKHPLSNAPDPKRRFIPSKSEHKEVLRLVTGIRKGHIKFEPPKEEKRVYDLWGEDSSSTDKARHGLRYIPPPKMKLPGHEESYNPSLEYIPTQEEIDSYELMYEEDRPKFIPRRYDSLRKVPAYDKYLLESFDRCLDLVLRPRVGKKRINIDPESLKPKLPSHNDAVTTISVHVSGQWLASGSKDGTVRIWEVETGRCIKMWDVGEAVSCVAWNPVPECLILAISAGQDVLVLNTGLGSAEEQQRVSELLNIGAPSETDNADKSTSIMSWLQHDKHEGIWLKHIKTVTSVVWHRKGDYFSIVMPNGDSRAVLVHQLSKKFTQRIPFKLHGHPVSSVFHPSRRILFIATKKCVRVYDLSKGKLIKKLEPGVREISSIAIHPAGDNIIVGSREGKVCWFDMDLSSQPFKKLRCHPKDITNVAFHRSYPLFAASSEDGTAYVLHGMVYSDLNKNPLIVPLEILRGHTTTDGRGVIDCTFHPRQPWLFTAGSDSVIKLYCH